MLLLEVQVGVELVLRQEQVVEVQVVIDHLHVNQ
jgi:hypothetical protein